MLLYSVRLYNYTIVQAEKKKEVTDDIRSFTFLLLVNHFELHQCLTNMCLLSFDNFPSSSIWHLLFAFFLTWSNMANQHPLQFPFSKSYLLFICTTFRKVKNKIMLFIALRWFYGYISINIYCIHLIIRNKKYGNASTIS